MTTAYGSLQSMRAQGHRVFDRLWKSGLMSRNEAYRMLAGILEIPAGLCHFSRFDEAQCQRVIDFCQTIDARPYFHPKLGGSRPPGRLDRRSKRQKLAKVARREGRYE